MKRTRAPAEAAARIAAPAKKDLAGCSAFAASALRWRRTVAPAWSLCVSQVSFEVDDVPACPPRAAEAPT